MQSRTETALTHTSGSDFTLRAHCSHFFCSAWLIQHHRTTLSSRELPAISSIQLQKKKLFQNWFKNHYSQHLHAWGFWAVPHNPDPAPDWCPCHLAKQLVSLLHLWREGPFSRKEMSWRAESAAPLFLFCQTASKQQQSFFWRIFNWGKGTWTGEERVEQNL